MASSLRFYVGDGKIKYSELRQ